MESKRKNTQETSENDETGEDDKAVDNEVWEFAWVRGEQKSVLGSSEKKEKDYAIEETNENDGIEDKAVDNVVEEFAGVRGEQKSVLGYQGTLVSLRLHGTGVSLRLPRYSGEP